MNKKIEAKIFLNEYEWPIIDVRSPAEFEQGHIPRAHNISLFSNEERAEVGILYKQSGRQPAILKGLDIVGPKMSGFVRQALSISPEKKMLMYCWRGGMRSESMAWLLAMAGFEVKVLIGGYKAYRSYIREGLSANAKYLVLSGATGSGKTEILHQLIESGQQVLDLEGIAHHKGSAFGALGEQAQPTTENYENLLYEVWKTFDISKPVWLEDESKFVGKVSIPEPLFDKMRTCQVVRIEMPLELRVKRLVKDYAAFPKNELISAIRRITRKLGGQNATTAIEAIENENFQTAIEIVLFYYDKTYNFGLSKREPEKVFHLTVDTIDASANAQKLLQFIKTINIS